MKKCENCNLILQDGDAFCPKCGGATVECDSGSHAEGETACNCGENCSCGEENRECGEQTAENVQALRFLDVITNEPVREMDEYSISALRTLARKAGRKQVYDCATYYPAKTAKQLIECERKDVFA